MGRIVVILFLMLFSCSQTNSKEQKKESNKVISTTDYELFISEKENGLLILFPCYPCDAINTKTEFSIVNEAIDNGVSVLLMNFNQHLYLLDQEKKTLATIVSNAIAINKLRTDNIFFGGFSSGGNVSLLLSDYLVKTKNKLQPKGVFIVDSPIDLLSLYQVAKKNLQQNSSEATKQESSLIIESLETAFGDPEVDLAKYLQFSPYIAKTNSIGNISGLKDLKLCFYTEPDLKWWKDYANNDWEDLNAYSIKKLAKQLKVDGAKQIEYIATENSGIRANGKRHPHSWSIVDEKELIKWVLK